MVLIILAIIGVIGVVASAFIIAMGHEKAPTHADVRAAYSQGYSDGRGNLPPADTTSGGRIILRKK